jgi:hypothetical protein
MATVFTFIMSEAGSRDRTVCAADKPRSIIRLGTYRTRSVLLHHQTQHPFAHRDSVFASDTLE